MHINSSLPCFYGLFSRAAIYHGARQRPDVCCHRFNRAPLGLSVLVGERARVDGPASVERGKTSNRPFVPSPLIPLYDSLRSLTAELFETRFSKLLDDDSKIDEPRPKVCGQRSSVLNVFSSVLEFRMRVDKEDAITLCGIFAINQNVGRFLTEMSRHREFDSLRDESGLPPRVAREVESDIGRAINRFCVIYAGRYRPAIPSAVLTHAQRPRIRPECPDLRLSAAGLGLERPAA